MNYTATHTSFYPFWLADTRTTWITTRGFTGLVQRNTVFESEVHQKQNVEPIPKTKGIGKHLDYGFGLIRYSRNSEMIRHEIQNKFAHDRIQKGRASHFQVLNVFPTFFLYYGTGYGSGLW